MPVKNTMK